ncbi:MULTISPECIES: hypothetical protein [Aquimarina]|uniref:Uncharacterized protein n=1 Tax=Aquimarina algiphila TaxID=2047982 RepID=A0A554VD05_9FLAO|nr:MULTISPECIES: hypothetical protein [Aquimarina]TSE04681.1 hypothetical protein FOF46_25435 [Aquimarina algiphila]
MTTKLQIAKILIVFGFLLSMTNYSVGLFNFYTCEDKTSVVLEESDNSEQKEKESSEKDDHKEKDKISQFYDDKEATLVDLFIKQYPEFYILNSLVYLEHKTPPPKYS